MEVLHFTTKDFEEQVLKTDGKVLVDFWATWCGPCKMMAPVLDAVAKEIEGNVKIGKVDVDENPEIASEYGIMSIPTFILFENGEVKTKLVGMQDKTTLLDLLK